MTDTISTDRLDLLPLAVGHAAEMAKVLSDTDLHTFTGGAPASPDALRSRYQRLVAGSPDPDVCWRNWVIRLREDGCLVGTVQATITRSPSGSTAEIAWVVGTAWQKRGIASEAARALVGWLGEQRVRTVIAHLHPDHHASANVASAVGLTPTGRRHDGEIRWEATSTAGGLADFRPAPNQGGDPALYEIENRALDPRGLVLDAMREAAPWAGRSLLDLGCGSGFWLPGYAEEAARAIGVEPDPTLLPLARRRDARVRVLAGSAEHIPLPDASVDVVHARFAYFFPPAGAAGLAEVLRVLRPGGALVVVDNDLRAGRFAELLARLPDAEAQAQGRHTDAWWAERGAERTEVMSEWRFDSRADFEAVLRLEFPAEVADPWLTANPEALGLSYGYVLFTVRR